MRAMILAAGLGSRLSHLTINKPKALIEISGIPMIEILINKLIESGIKDVIINVHHFSEQIKAFLKLKNDFGINIAFSDESDLLLDTAGGIKKASWFFENEKEFLVHNVDVITNLNFAALIKYHIANKSFATLAVKSRKTSRYFLFDKNMKLSGWKNIKEDKEIITQNDCNLTKYGFSGIQVLSNQILKYLDDSKPNSITKSYIELSKSNNIYGYVHNNNYWFDLGKPENIAEAELFLLRNI